ncbi:MAG: hypothetical protein JWP13_789 [Candidatus Saccharibacteria bacterium]|nr:hypothetical protein [Candidatus Saccharibacteria bacterium]
MPDDSKRDVSTPQSGRSVSHLAESAPMEMSAPMEEMPSDEPPAQLMPPPSSIIQGAAPPLSEDVAPFTTAAPQRPAVEYVAQTPVSPKPEPPPLPAPPPVPLPRPIPRPQPRAAVPPPGRTPPAPIPQATTIAQSIAPPEASMPPALPTQTTQSPKRASKIYSHNTSAVWGFHRSTRIIYMFILVALAIVAAIFLVYWLSIGSPTHMEDIPFVRSLLNL